MKTFLFCVCMLAGGFAAGFYYQTSAGRAAANRGVDVAASAMSRGTSAAHSAIGTHPSEVK